MTPFPFHMRRSLLLLALGVLFPGLVLAGLGLRTLAQDRRLADGQVRERLDRAAADASGRLEHELNRWEAAVSRVRGNAPLPEPIFEAVSGESGAVLVVAGDRRVQVIPQRSLLWQPALFSSSNLQGASASPALEAAERMELRDSDLARAATAYAGIARRSQGEARAAALVRLARTWRKAGNERQAREAYLNLQRLGATLADGLPADLIAQYELCVTPPAGGDGNGCPLGLYRDLVLGRWPLDRPWYEVYSTGTWERIQGRDRDRTDVRDLKAREAAKRAITELVERAATPLLTGQTAADSGQRAAASTRGADLIFWRWSPSSQHTVVLVLPARFLATVWPGVFREMLRDDVDVVLTAPGGSQAFASAPAPAVSAAMVNRSFQHGDVAWRIGVWLRRPAALYGAVRLRQNLYLAMLAVMVVSLVLATVVTFRMVGKELEVARLKSQFVSAVSHEFRTPLTGIRQFAEMLVNGRVEGEERRQRYYQWILGASERLARLVENVLDAARIEEGRQQYNLVPLETSPWLRGVVSDFQAMLTGGKEVCADIPDDLPAIAGDGQALARAVENLLDNGLKYSPDGDTVWLTAAPQDGGAVIQIRDEGVGIPAHEQNHVFERFFRGAQLGESVRGAGLGLSLVRHIVLAHGGTVDFESAPGRGTTFTLWLPAYSRSSEP